MSHLCIASRDLLVLEMIRCALRDDTLPSEYSLDNVWRQFVIDNEYVQALRGTEQLLTLDMHIDILGVPDRISSRVDLVVDKESVVHPDRCTIIFEPMGFKYWPSDTVNWTYRFKMEDDKLTITSKTGPRPIFKKPF